MNAHVEHILSRMVIPDAYLPSQWIELPGPPVPLARLYKAVLDEAVRNLRAETKQGREAHAWFWADADGYPFSFEMVCEVLSLSPSIWRRAAEIVWEKRIRPTDKGAQRTSIRSTVKIVRRVSHSTARRIQPA